MKIKEALRNLNREIVDDFLGRDSNPEHMENFSFHLQDCSRRKPLQINTHSQGPIPSWGNAGIGFETIRETITCPECEGKEIIKF